MFIVVVQIMFLLNYKIIFFTLKQRIVRSCVPETRKKKKSLNLKNAKASLGSFAFTTLFPMANTIFSEILVAARCEPTMTSFVF